MKECLYCGRKSEDEASNCSGCGLDEFKSDVPVPSEKVAEPADLIDLPLGPGLAAADLKTIATQPLGQVAEIMEQLRAQAIPAEVRTVMQASGLEMSEIMVAGSDYDRGCEVVETWAAEQLAAAKWRSRIYCRLCGSRNYSSSWNERVGTIYHCKDCDKDFLW